MFERTMKTRGDIITNNLRDIRLSRVFQKYPCTVSTSKESLKKIVAKLRNVLDRYHLLGEVSQ